MYFVHGTAPNDWTLRNAIEEPMNGGYAIVLFLPNERGGGLIFSPFTLESWAVPAKCCELSSAEWLDDDFDPDKIAGAIKRAWDRYASYTAAKAYDLAASILRKLGHEAPAETPIAQAVESGDRAKGGKAPEATGDTKPIRPGTKRAEIAAFFISTASIHEAMSQFTVTRSGVLSHLHCIHKYHGIGYEVVGDAARLLVPEGCVLFEEVDHG
jgi:hypothetical protein